MAYELEIMIKRKVRPFRVTGVEAEVRVKEIVESFLAAWGIPAPESFRGAGKSTFAVRLAETGSYRHDEADYLVVAKRSE